LVAKAPGVGVAEAGNQSIVGVGSGVSVGMTGVGVAFNASNTAQELNVEVTRIRRMNRINDMDVGYRDFMECVVK
jgi:hypothetical protein